MSPARGVGGGPSSLGCLGRLSPGSSRSFAARHRPRREGQRLRAGGRRAEHRLFLSALPSLRTLSEFGFAWPLMPSSLASAGSSAGGETDSAVKREKGCGEHSPRRKRGAWLPGAAQFSATWSSVGRAHLDGQGRAGCRLRGGETTHCPSREWGPLFSAPRGKALSAGQPR